MNKVLKLNFNSIILSENLEFILINNLRYKIKNEQQHQKIEIEFFYTSLIFLKAIFN